MVPSGYLPLPGFGQVSSTTDASSRGGLLSWLFRRVKIVLGVAILIVLLLQSLILVPYFLGPDRLKSWGIEGVPHPPQPPDWMQPPWRETPSTSPPTHPPGYGLPKPKPNKNFPPSVSPIEPPIPPGYEPPYSSISDKLRLSPAAFPPPYAEGRGPNLTKIRYPDGDPHAGIIPSLQFSILNMVKEPQRPPRPAPAPAINSTMYEQVLWTRKNNGSTTGFEDSFKAHLQPLTPDPRQKPYYGWRPPLAALDTSTAPKEKLGKVQFSFEAPSRRSGRHGDYARETVLIERQRLVRNAFLHAWEGYKRLAWGHDELRPVSQEPLDSFNGWGATIVDALDTLLVMDLPQEYDLARQHVRDIDFRHVGGERSAYGSQDGRIPVFETAIRYLGGFLAAYDLSGDELMRDRAEELAQLLGPAFSTNTGVPLGRIRFNQLPYRGAGGGAILAEAGSMLLELTRLWQVTGNRTYFDRVQRTTDWLDFNMTSQAKLGALMPTTIFPESKNGYGWYSFGGMCDSYYEYLIKEHQLLGGRIPQYGRMYEAAIESARKWLIRDIVTVPGTPLVVFGLSNKNVWDAKLEHLACFTGGMMGLGSKLIPSRSKDYDLAQRLTETCWWTYNSSATGIGPEDTTFYRVGDHDRWQTVTHDDGTKERGGPSGFPIAGVKDQTTDYRGRPETIESIFYMWRITGDEIWQERGWQMFCSWVTHSMTTVGFANIYDVTKLPANLVDSMESFVFAETFKYYYLLFSPPDLISLDDYVLTTEAHPLLLPRDGRWTRPGTGPKKFWTPPASASEAPARPNGAAGNGTAVWYSGGEDAPVVGGLTNAQKHDLYNSYVKKVELARQKAEAAKAKAKLAEAMSTAKEKSEDAVMALVGRVRDWIGSSDSKEDIGEKLEVVLVDHRQLGDKDRDKDKVREVAAASVGEIEGSSKRSDAGSSFLQKRESAGADNEALLEAIRTAFDVVKAQAQTQAQDTAQRVFGEDDMKFSEVAAEDYDLADLLDEDDAEQQEKSYTVGLIETDDGPVEVRIETSGLDLGGLDFEALLGDAASVSSPDLTAEEILLLGLEKQADRDGRLARNRQLEGLESLQQSSQEEEEEVRGDLRSAATAPQQYEEDRQPAAAEQPDAAKVEDIPLVSASSADHPSVSVAVSVADKAYDEAHERPRPPPAPMGQGFAGRLYARQAQRQREEALERERREAERAEMEERAEAQAERMREEMRREVELNAGGAAPGAVPPG